MALEQTILIALRKNDTDKTTLMNMDEKYERAVIGATFRYFYPNSKPTDI